jgi:hypothetical protein
LRYDTVLRVTRYVAIHAPGLTILLSLPNYHIMTYCMTLGYTTTIKCVILLKAGNTAIATVDDFKRVVAQTRQDKLPVLHCEFATVQYQSLHTTEGSLMLHYDKLNVIAWHLQSNRDPTVNQFSVPDSAPPQLKTPPPADTAYNDTQIPNLIYHLWSWDKHSPYLN